MNLLEQLLGLAETLVPLAALFMLLGLWATMRRRGSLSPHLSREFSSNIGWYFFDGLIVVPSVLVVVAVFAFAVERVGLGGVLLGSYTSAWHPAAQFLVVVLASDLAGYWRHRLLHHPLLWPAHAVHHSDVAVHWLTLIRIHPLERWANAAFDTVILTLCGFPAEMIAANNLLRHYYGFWLHFDFRKRYGLLRHVFVSPSFHRWHHATDAAARDRNFAVIFSFVDRMFGSFYLPAEEPERFGLGEDRQPVAFFEQLWMPFGLWWRTIAAWSRYRAIAATAAARRDS
jgi:sterol desaturase/sphingolipid hydroxylase (fatty acid hydroxylase superfamily)